MIEEELLRKLYTRSEFNSIVDALKILDRLGVFTHQVKENEQRVVASFTAKPADQLAQEILQVQQTNRQLLALHELADRIQKEEENA